MSLSPDSPQINHHYRRGLIIAAPLSIISGIIIFYAAGLPQRAPYTGYIVDSQFVAPEIGALAPPFTAQTRSEEAVSLADYAGVPVVLNFWATWCLPCEAELPELEAFQASANGAAQVIAINTGEAPTWVEPWLDARRITLNTAYDPDSEIANTYRLRGQPTNFIIAPDGTIVTIFYGPITRQQLESALEAYL